MEFYIFFFRSVSPPPAPRRSTSPLTSGGPRSRSRIRFYSRGGSPLSVERFMASSIDMVLNLSRRTRSPLSLSLFLSFLSFSSSSSISDLRDQARRSRKPRLPTRNYARYPDKVSGQANHFSAATDSVGFYGGQIEPFNRSDALFLSPSERNTRVRVTPPNGPRGREWQPFLPASLTRRDQKRLWSVSAPLCFSHFCTALHTRLVLS